jgi:hypothetical protein
MAHRTHAAEPMRREAVRSGDILRPSRDSGYFESYKSEIAAYELDRLLGLDMVPVTVERRVDGALAAVQLWIEDCRLLTRLDQGSCREKGEPAVFEF